MKEQKVKRYSNPERIYGSKKDSNIIFLDNIDKYYEEDRDMEKVEEKRHIRAVYGEKGYQLFEDSCGRPEKAKLKADAF